MNPSKHEAEIVRQILRDIVDALRPDLQSCTSIVENPESGSLVVRLDADTPYKYTLEITQPLPERRSIEAEILRFLQFASPREQRTDYSVR